MRVEEAQLDKPAADGVIVRRTWQKHLITFLMVFGPGLIVMEADKDAGAVSTYMQAGGQYGLHLLWLMVVLLPICYFVQEMVARLGIVTGKGHAAMIYERFGKWWGHGGDCAHPACAAATGHHQRASLRGAHLPSAIIFLQLLLNDRELLGDRWVNRRWNNIINWTIIVVLFALSLLLAAQVMLPSLFKS